MSGCTHFFQSTVFAVCEFAYNVCNPWFVLGCLCGVLFSEGVIYIYVLPAGSAQLALCFMSAFRLQLSVPVILSSSSCCTYILSLFLVSLSRSGVIQGLLVFALWNAAFDGFLQNWLEQGLCSGSALDFLHLHVQSVHSLCVIPFSFGVQWNLAFVLFLMCALVINSHYGMSWSDKPNMTSTWGTSCGQLVRSVQHLSLIHISEPTRPP